MTMKCWGTVAVTVLGLCCLRPAVPVAQATAQNTLIDVGGHKLNVRGLGASRPGVPAVVFESGLGSPIDSWGGVPAEVARTTRTVAYERAGIGASEPGPEPRSVKQIVAELHALLAKIEVPPPYVLVGHSYGGPLIHSFAATYPKEVAGFVYVDPTDFMQTDADVQAIWDKLGVKDGRDAMRALQGQMTASAPAGVKAEARELDRLERSGLVDFRAAGEPPDVPTVVLLAGKSQPLPPSLTFPVPFDRYFQALLEQRRDHFARLTGRAAKGTFIETSKSSHFIHMTEPELLTWAIQRVLSSTASHADLDRFVGEYRLAPSFAIAITRDGDRLFAQATGQAAFALSADTPTKFSLSVVDAQIEFETDAAGKVTALVLVQNGRRQRAPKT
jgi:pimeloyl-ACP methyl ester carboxylesterase